MRTRKTLLTAEELFRLSTTGRRYELVKGELFEMPPAGGRHGNVVIQIGGMLNAYVRANQLGAVFAAETGFILRRNPDTVRAPDASFVSKERLPAGELPIGFMEMAPDLAVEVVSPSDTAREVREKVEDWLRAGTRLVWTIPATRSVIVYRSLDDFQELSERDDLDGSQVVPGFTCHIRDLFY
jgi:Uma2 family endonuclease